MTRLTGDKPQTQDSGIDGVAVDLEEDVGGRCVVTEVTIKIIYKEMVPLFQVEAGKKR